LTDKSLEKQRVAIIIAGMHRSGTSALAGAIAKLGAALPSRLNGAAPGNEFGHWEPMRLVELNDALLAEGGTAWDDWRAFDPQNLADRLGHFEDVITETIKTDFGDAQLLVLKDPRICRMIPLYVRIFEKLDVLPVFVVPFRHPTEVGQSLNARDALSMPYAELVWARHVLDAERTTRGSRRLFLSYNTLMDDPVTALALVADKLGVLWPTSPAAAKRELEAFLLPERRHHVGGDRGDLGPSKCGAFVRGIYGELLALENNPSDQEALVKMATLAARLDSLDAATVSGAAEKFDSEDSRGFIRLMKAMNSDSLPAHAKAKYHAYRIDREVRRIARQIATFLGATRD
jgi:hypothetical protein